MPAAIAKKAAMDVFGSSLNDFDPFAEDDEDFGGGFGGDAEFGDFADFGNGSTNDFFKASGDDDNVQHSSRDGVQAGKSPDPSRSERRRSSRNLKKSSSTKNLHGSSEKLASEDATGGIERNRGESRRGSKSPGPHSRRSVQRSRSGEGSGMGVGRGDGGQSAVDDNTRRPPMRRRSSNRKALMTDNVESHPRVSRSRSSDREVPSVSENENDEEVIEIPKTPSTSSRRSSMSSSHRQLSTRRLGGGSSASLRNLFQGNVEHADQTNAVADKDDDTCIVSVSHSVMQRPSSRRGNLNRNFSGLKSPSSVDDNEPRTVGRTVSMMNRKLHGDRSPPDGHRAPQRSVSATIRRSASRREVLLSPGGQSAEGSVEAPTDSNGRSLRRAPPPRSASTGETLNRRSQLHRRQSGLAQKKQLQRPKEEEEE